MSSAAIPLTTAQRRGARDQLRRLLDPLCDFMSATGRAVARMIGLPESTLRSWRRRGRCLLEGIRLPPRGRPRRVADQLTRNDILTVIHAAAGRISVSTLKEAYPAVGRAQLRDLLRRYRRVCVKRGRRALATLEWMVPGAVWAMDFGEIQGGVEDVGKYLLVIRDLASGATLESRMFAAPDATSVCLALRALIALHGAPLVIKCDNGSCFLAEMTKEMLAAVGVLMLFSPPGIPSYNGSCEAGVGTIKHRLKGFAGLRGDGAGVTLDDVETARLQANEQPMSCRLGAKTRGQVWDARPVPCPLLRAEVARRAASWERRLRTDKGIVLDDGLPHAEQASLDRFAIGKALREMNLLVIRRR